MPTNPLIPGGAATQPGIVLGSFNGYQNEERLQSNNPYFVNAVTGGVRQLGSLNAVSLPDPEQWETQRYPKRSISNEELGTQKVIDMRNKFEVLGNTEGLDDVSNQCASSNNDFPIELFLNENRKEFKPPESQKSQESIS